MEQSIIDLLVGLVQNFPWFSTVLLVMGTSRAVFKALSLAAEAYVLETPDASDNEKLATFKSGKIYGILDYVFSIKVPNKQP